MRSARHLLMVMVVATMALLGCNGDRAVDPSSQTAGGGATESSDDVQSALKTVKQLEKAIAEPDGGVASLTRSRLLSGHSTVSVPAGSVDALADAIASAGPGGIVVLKSGMHTESGTVEISQRVTLVGLPGAILQVATDAAPPAPFLEPALYVHNAAHVAIWGIDIRPATAPGGTGILLENAPNALISGNTISDHQFGIVVEQADRSVLFHNTISLATSAGGHGITVVNGDYAIVAGNNVSGATFGIWACDRKGVLLGNNTHHNLIGIILCKVPAAAFPLPSGAVAGSDESAMQWFAKGNTSTNNQWGYLVIDGANHCTLVGNGASDNGAYDMEFSGDSMRFGFPTPASFDCTAIIDDPNMVVKDCGMNNTVIGGNPVDVSVDPCF